MRSTPVYSRIGENDVNATPKVDMRDPCHQERQIPFRPLEFKHLQKTLTEYSSPRKDVRTMTSPNFNYQTPGVLGGAPKTWSNVQFIPKTWGVLAFNPNDGSFAKWYNND